MNIGEWYYFTPEHNEWKLQMLSPMVIAGHGWKIMYMDLDSWEDNRKFTIRPETGSTDSAHLWAAAREEQFRKAIRIIFK
jgi:hypothetical protein